MKGPRPETLVVVVGTGTEVGKTWVSASVLAAARFSGMSVAARKPAQSFEPGEGPTDAELLGEASGEDPEVVCPAHRWYEVPFAPPMAAASLGRSTILQDDLFEEMVWPEPRVDLGLVEMAGGVASPISLDGDPGQFVRALQPDHLLLVADAGLGVVNAVRLSLRSLSGVAAEADPDGADSQITVVVNRFDPDQEIHWRNVSWLSDHDHIDSVVSLEGDAATCGSRLVDRVFPDRY